MNPSRSLRARLSITYAAIALLTAVILGGILLGVLSSYFGRAESDYLRAAAERVSAEALPAGGQQLALWATVYALETQTRIQVYDRGGALIADSGSPRNLDTRALRDGGRGRDRHDPLPDPLGSGFFGSPSTAPRGGQTLTVDASGGERIVLSEPPASGRDVLRSVAQGWVLAALLAVVLAAVAGYLFAARVTRPLDELTEASDRMAEGDLTARAPIDGKDEVARLATSFNGMAEQMETTVSELRRFVGDAAHQIGTPLTALQADLELAERAATTDDERRLVSRALGQARRLEALSDGLLRLSRIEAGERTDEATRFDLAPLVKVAADTIASRAEQAGIDFAVSVPEDELKVVADRAQIVNVVDSLLDNAVKFTPAGGRIALELRRFGTMAEVAVADTGVGIPAAEHDDVFRRFHRARNVQSIPGSGLGLAIVKASVERAGGRVEFTSDDAGTTFVMSLPLA